MSFEDYEAHGWRLCAIEPGKKGPVYDGWNVSPMPAESIVALGIGAGLLHALSGTCALDIDDMEPARAWWAEQGVDIDALRNDPTSVHISSGRAGRDKLLYRLSTPLRTVKPKGHGFELRCATAGGESVQDVLPPSVHPITKKPYTWKYGDELIASWDNLPNIPGAVYRVWRELVESEPTTEIVNEKPQERPVDLVRTAIKGYIGSRKLDMNNYDDWIDVGMRLHKQTGGGLQGLKIWDEVSRGVEKYKGVDDLKTHWVSFQADGRIGMEAALREVPATADEFPIESATPEAPSETEQAVQQSNRDKLNAAKEFLEGRLVYVADIEKYFDTQRHRIFATEAGIEHTFTSRMPKRKGSHISPVKLLKESSTKRIVDRLGFHPGEATIFTEHGDTYANIYRPRLPEPLEPTADELSRISWLFDRIDDVPYREWLLRFYGHVVQRPGVKIKSAPLIWSDTQGNGKTTLLRMIPALLVGYQYSREVNSGVLNSDFNDFLLNAWHINLTEFRAGSRNERDAISKKVESWIADDALSIHPKGSAAFTVPNHFFVTASSNADDAALITNNDRKWAIHELRAPQFTEEEQQWMYNDFLLTARAPGVLRSIFMGTDLSGFSASARAPETAARAEMVRAGTASDLEYLITAFEERDGPFAKDVVLTHEVQRTVHKNCPVKPSADRVGKLLTRAPFHGKAIQFRAGEGRFRGIVLYNHPRWVGARGAEIMAHIQGDDVSVDDELLS